MSPARRPLDYRIDPFDLQLFAAVVEHGTITAAAGAMGLSLAAASTRLKALEHRVGAALLARSKAGARPTDAGRALVRQAHRVLAEIDSLHVEMAAFGHGLRGRIRLMCNTAASTEALSDRLGRFLAGHPDTDVDLQELSSDAVLEALRGGAADVGIVADYVDTSGLLARDWLDDELVAVLPARRSGRHAAAAVTLRFSQLLAQPFVGLPEHRGLSRFLQQQAARSGLVPRHRVRLGSFDAVIRLVAAGVGVAVMPRSAAERWHAPGVRVAALSDAWARRRLLLCTTAHTDALPGVRRLVDALMSG